LLRTELVLGDVRGGAGERGRGSVLRSRRRWRWWWWCSQSDGRTQFRRGVAAVHAGRRQVVVVSGGAVVWCPTCIASHVYQTTTSSSRRGAASPASPSPAYRPTAVPRALHHTALAYRVTAADRDFSAEVFHASSYSTAKDKACLHVVHGLNWPATSRPSYTTRSLVTRVDATTRLATAKLGRLVLSQFVRCKQTFRVVRLVFWTALLHAS